MRKLVLAAVTVTALVVTAGAADARPLGFRGGLGGGYAQPYYGGGLYNRPYYNTGFYNRPYYGGLNNGYYGGYGYRPGLSFGVGVGNGYYPGYYGSGYRNFRY